MIEKPIPFKRGSTFSFLFRIATYIEPNMFPGWKLTAQLRKEGSNSINSHIADINVTFADKETTVFFAHHSLTDKWPLGYASLDIVLESPSGHRLATQTVPFHIVQDVTR